MSPDWEEDCLHWHGEILRGPGAHWCSSFDDLPIDASCHEWKRCQCFDPADKAAIEHSLMVKELRDEPPEGGGSRVGSRSQKELA